MIMRSRNINYLGGILFGLGVGLACHQAREIIFIGLNLVVTGVLLYLSPLGDRSNRKRRKHNDKLYLDLDIDFQSDETVIECDPETLATLSVEEQKNLWASLIYYCYQMNGRLLDRLEASEVE